MSLRLSIFDPGNVIESIIRKIMYSRDKLQAVFMLAKKFLTDRYLPLILDNTQIWIRRD